MACEFHNCVNIAEELPGTVDPSDKRGHAGLTDHRRGLMVIALAGIFCWLLVLATALSLGAAAKRGDELNEKARTFVADSQTGAEIIRFDSTLLQRQLCRAPIQCRRSCTISSSRR
jgi:hypothetical protein